MTTRTRKTLAIAGTNRGAAASLPFIAAHNNDSAARSLDVYPIDPQPGRAAAFAAQATALGVKVTRHEQALVEDVLARGLGADAVLVHTDTPAAQRAVVDQVRDVPVLQLLLLRLPTGELVSLQGVIRPRDAAARGQLLLLLTALDGVRARRGSAFVFPAGAPRPDELRARAGFGTYFRENARVLVDLEPEVPPLALQRAADRRPEALVVLPELPAGRRTPESLRQDVLSALDVPLVRGDRVHVAEVGREVVLHELRLRRDGELAVRGLPLRAVEQDGTIQRRLTVETLARASVSTADEPLSRTNAVTTSD